MLYLGDVSLAMDHYVASYNCHRLSTRSGQRVMGILGFDCLRHYCIQLDFDEEKVRFMASERLKAPELGTTFPLTLCNGGRVNMPMFSGSGQNETLPFIHHAGLLGGPDTDVLIDTGYNTDGSVERKVVKGHYLTRLVHFFMPFWNLRISSCEWDGEPYTKLRIGTDKSLLGLRFLARHLVTFDFPNERMYLRRTSAGAPLGKPK